MSGLLTENLLLAAAGGGIGLLIARWSLPVLQRMVPQSMAGFVELHLDARALGFTTAMSVAASVLFGLAPALQLARCGPTGRSAIGQGNRRLANLLIEGQPAPRGVGQDALFRLVSAGYLQTIGARLKEGRLLDDRDRDGLPPVVVVNATLARQYWPAESSLGHRIDTGTGARRWMTIVGVVDDVRERGLDLALQPGVYVPFTQTDITFFQPSELAVLTSRAPLTIATELQEAVHMVDAEQPVSNLRTMDDIVSEELSGRTQVLQLLGTFAALAVVLAALGTYAVMSYVVSQRTKEIGLRLAIGARPQDILRAMLGYSAKLAVAGVFVGLAAAAAATRLLTSLLFGVTPLDAKTLAGVAALLTMVALVASYVPTRRAASLDPVAALRGE